MSRKALPKGAGVDPAALSPKTDGAPVAGVAAAAAPNVVGTPVPNPELPKTDEVPEAAA